MKITAEINEAVERENLNWRDVVSLSYRLRVIMAGNWRAWDVA
jgi:hypothetical protein